MRKKILSSRGETLVETLAAILIAALASLMLTYSAVAATRINKAAESADERYAADIMAAEAMTPDTEAGSGTLHAAGNSVDYTFQVDFFGGNGHLTSFAEGGRP